MEFIKEQISELMCKHAEREHGLHDIFEIMLESMMAAERTEFLHEMRDGNKGNGYRLGHTYGQGRKLEFRIPRDRYGNFPPQILAVLKNQEEECDRRRVHQGKARQMLLLRGFLRCDGSTR